MLTTTEAADAPQRVQATVFIVDDDERVLHSIKWEMESVGYSVQAFGSAAEFLSAYNPDTPGCLILDVRMPQMSGLELQEVLKQRGWGIPVIMISAHGEVPVAVQAMKADAVDFLCKPFRGQNLLDAVNDAISKDAEVRRKQQAISEIRRKLASLTPREHEVLGLVVKGMTSKEISETLGVHYKTIEAHRANISKKMGAKNAVDLIRMVKDAEQAE